LRLLEDERADGVDDLFVGHLQVEAPGTMAVARASVAMRLSPNFGGRSSVRSSSRSKLIAFGQLRDEPALVEQAAPRALARRRERSAAGAEFACDRDDHPLSEYPV